MMGTSAPGTPPSPSLFTAASLFTSPTHLSRIQPQINDRYQRSRHSDDHHLQSQRALVHRAVKKTSSRCTLPGPLQLQLLPSSWLKTGRFPVSPPHPVPLPSPTASPVPLPRLPAAPHIVAAPVPPPPYRPLHFISHL